MYTYGVRDNDASYSFPCVGEGLPAYYFPYVGNGLPNCQIDCDFSYGLMSSVFDVVAYCRFQHRRWVDVQAGTRTVLIPGRSMFPAWPVVGLSK